MTDTDTTALPAEAFLALGVEESYLYRLDKQGISTPTDIQTQAIPHVFEGRDLVARAPTGSGKSAAFLLPILQRTWSDQARVVLEPGMPRSLILVPTRELAAQLGRMARALQPPKTTQPCEITGGVPYPPQFRLLDRPQPVMIATPGRLIDLMDDQRISLSMLETLVLDEADRMLEMGFTEALDQVLAAAPENCQKLLFSATVPRWVERAADRFLRDPVRVEVGSRHGNTPQIEQGVYYCSVSRKSEVLQTLLEDEALTKVVVFVNAKVRANELEKELRKAGITATSLHGDHNQSMRRKALARFRDDEVRVLVASDVAARGVDLPAVSHVINFDMPRELETYIHRIGRTGRAQKEGVAIALCDGFEMSMIRLIERKQEIEMVVLADELPAKAKHKKDKGSKHLRPEWSNKRGVRRGEEAREDRVYASGFDPDDEARRAPAAGHKKRASNADARPMSGARGGPRDRGGYGERSDSRFGGKPGPRSGPKFAGRGGDSEGFGRNDRGPRAGRPDGGERSERRPERNSERNSERAGGYDRPERSERPERSGGYERRDGYESRGASDRGERREYREDRPARRSGGYDRPNGDRSYADRPRGDREGRERGNYERSSSDRLSGERDDRRSEYRDERRPAPGGKPGYKAAGKPGWGARDTAGKPGAKRDGRSPAGGPSGHHSKAGAKFGPKPGPRGARPGAAPKLGGKGFADSGPVRPKRQARGSYIDAALDRVFGGENDEG